MMDVSARLEELVRMLDQALAAAQTDVARLAAARAVLVGGQDEAVPAPPVKMPRAKPGKPERVAASAPRKVGATKYPLDEVAAIARAAYAAGASMGPAVAEHYATTKTMGSFLLTKARKAGHDVPTSHLGRLAKAAPSSQVQSVEADEADEAESFTAEPMTKAPFDPDATRAAMADQVAPREGRGGTSTLWQPTVKPVTVHVGTLTAPEWTPDRAREAIEAAR